MRKFIKDSLRTESLKFNRKIGADLNSERLIHAAFGLQTESAEFTDGLKKSIFYGKDVDVTNLKEELGDMMWYMAIAFDELNTDFETEASRVIAKLQKRYPEKFTSFKAENRDLDAERRVLEEGK